MGNICSKSANDDNFSTPGRVLGGGSEPRSSRAPVPAKITSSTPGRTLGGSESATSPNDAQSAAARAAEVSSPTCNYICDHQRKIYALAFQTEAAA